MEFKKLPSNSENLLHKLVGADSPAQILCSLFEKASPKEDDELRGIIRELRQEGYIDVKWADDVPYFVTLNNSARAYQEQLAEYGVQKTHPISQEKDVNPVVFISHRSTDKKVADMIADFFSATGISRDKIFCSSLPGNDINEKISTEVKFALKNSSVNIAILSYDYYQSAYCLNEAGVLWYNDAPVIPIALPEIDSNNMYGFLSSEYKLRRLDSDTDISYIYDIVSEAVSAPYTKVSIVTYENNKLQNRYADFLKSRKSSKPSIRILPAIDVSEITTDDERVVLYYILQQNVRKVSKSAVFDWLHKNEIYSINVDNAFDLLSSFDDENRTLFLKLAVVSLVTKFQVFVEKVLDEFRYNLNGMTSGSLPLYMKMNAIRLSVMDGNALIGIQKHHFTEEKKTKIVNYLNSISFISDENAEIDESFRFKTKFPLGKTGKGELVELLSQIDGDQNPFENFDADDFDKLDSVLQTRHLIIHQDRFTGTETTVTDNVFFIKNLVEYIDEYLFLKAPI